jgi:hypothetical protein
VSTRINSREWGGRFRFLLPHKKIAPVAVEFPVYPAGIVAGDIRPVIDQILGAPAADICPALQSPGTDSGGERIFRRRGAYQEPGFRIPGQADGELEKTQGIADGKGIVIAVIGPPQGDLERQGGRIRQIRIKDILHRASIPGFKAYHAANQNPR